jgi:hypothetical protein
VHFVIDFRLLRVPPLPGIAEEISTGYIAKEVEHPQDACSSIISLFMKAQEKAWRDYDAIASISESRWDDECGFV